MRENFKSGSMRGGWQGTTLCLGDLSTAGKPSENARQTNGSAEPVAYSTAACPHSPRYRSYYDDEVPTGNQKHLHT
jgi:hypothetical protein